MIPVRPARPVLRERSDRLLSLLTGQKEFWNYSVDKMEHASVEVFAIIFNLLVDNLLISVYINNVIKKLATATSPARIQILQHYIV